MTRREWLVSGSLSFFAFGCRSRRAAGPAAVVESVFGPSLAVSLRGLAASFAKGGLRAARVANLGGLNRFSGLSVENDGDVLLLGHAESRLPALHIDDLAVTIRSAFHAGTAYREPIGCTIDPREGASDPWAMQVARTFGTEPSAMAARHIAIDYEMKKASLGLVVLKPGMPTLMDNSDAVSECAGAGKTNASKDEVYRFWFCPKVADAPRFVRDGQAVWIQKPVQVQVLTEQEFLDSKAHRVGSKAAVGPAVRFAEAMTGLLASGDLPQYAALNADFRLIEAAKLVPVMGVGPSALRYFLHEHELRKAAVPAYVGGLWREESSEITCSNDVDAKPTSDGTSYQSHADIRRSQRKVIGGVEARIPIEAKDVRAGKGELGAIMGRIRQARPSADAAFWTVPV